MSKFKLILILTIFFLQHYSYAQSNNTVQIDKVNIQTTNDLTEGFKRIIKTEYNDSLVFTISEFNSIHDNQQNSVYILSVHKLDYTLVNKIKLVFPVNKNNSIKIHFNKNNDVFVRISV